MWYHLGLCWVRCYFVIYISNLDSGISGEVGKFKDDEKVGRVIKTAQDVRQLQGDLDRLYGWVRKW